MLDPLSIRTEGVLTGGAGQPGWTAGRCTLAELQPV